jgi:AGZA family xanthine/uracil permease-like MFS transporter
LGEALHSPTRSADVIGGITTFFTMSYIVVVNPSILASPGTGMAFSGVLTATVLVASSMTLLMGLYARLPFAVAPGMGLNAFFAYTVVIGNGVPWQTALGIVFWAGVLSRRRRCASGSRPRSRPGCASRPPPGSACS